MHKSKGKWKASAKDTWSVENSLSPIILSYLQKLYDELEKSKSHGVPLRYVEQQEKIQGIVDPCLQEVDFDAADELRFKDLGELMWVFGSEEPIMEDYDFKIDIVEAEEHGRFGKLYKTAITNQEEYDRYTRDVDGYWERKLKGYKLFGEVYNDLQW